jgi:glutathione reductase (NADPH)
MIQLAAIAVKAGITKKQWDSTMALHPTAAEEIVLLREKVPSAGSLG